MTLSERERQLEKKDVFISCIVPVFNESANVASFFSELHGMLEGMAKRFEIIVIDDGSRDTTVDDTLKLPKAYGIKLLKFSRNFGKEVALMAGLEHCSGDVAIIIDADFQHPISLLPRFLRGWGKGHDMVYGVRDNRDNESLLKRAFARLFYWSMEKLTDIHIPHNAGDFRLLDHKVVNALNQFKERARFTKGLYAWVGFKKLAVPYTVQDRAHGKSRWGFLKLAELAMTGVMAFSNVPLRIWGFIGLVISSISLIYTIYLIAVTLFYGTDLPGFPTLAAAIMFFGGVQLLSIGILGEYIARIFTEVKHRPAYILEATHGFDDL